MPLTFVRKFSFFVSDTRPAQDRSRPVQKGCSAKAFAWQAKIPFAPQSASRLRAHIESRSECSGTKPAEAAKQIACSLQSVQELCPSSLCARLRDKVRFFQKSAYIAHEQLKPLVLSFFSRNKNKIPAMRDPVEIAVYRSPQPPFYPVSRNAVSKPFAHRNADPQRIMTAACVKENRRAALLRLARPVYALELLIAFQ